MTEPYNPPDQMSVVLEKLADLAVNQKKLVEESVLNKELREQLLNEVQIKRKRILEAEADRPTLTVRQKEFEKQYKTKNLDLRTKTKHDFPQYYLGNAYRYFNPKFLTDYPWLIFTEDPGYVECLTCQMSGSGFKTDRIYDSSRFITHEFSDQHKNSSANLKQAIHFRADDNKMFEYPFNPKPRSLVQSARRATIPIEHERKRIVLDTHIKELVQGQAARGGTVRLKFLLHISAAKRPNPFCLYPLFFHICYFIFLFILFSFFYFFL